GGGACGGSGQGARRQRLQLLLQPAFRETERLCPAGACSANHRGEQEDFCGPQDEPRPHLLATLTRCPRRGRLAAPPGSGSQPGHQAAADAIMPGRPRDRPDRPDPAAQLPTFRPHPPGHLRLGHDGHPRVARPDGRRDRLDPAERTPSAHHHQHHLRPGHEGRRRQAGRPCRLLRHPHPDRRRRRRHVSGAPRRGSGALRLEDPPPRPRPRPRPGPGPASASPAFPPSAAAARTAVILWSSGTSGRSKGVLLSHNALNASVAALWHDADFYAARPQPQSWLGYVPFYHVFGLCNVFLLAVAAGATVYTMTGFHLETVLRAIRDHKVTYLHMAPPVAVMLAKAAVVEPYAASGAFRSVVAAVTGGAPLGHEVVVEVHKRCGFRIRLGYGLSETGSTSMQRGVGEKEMHAHAGDTGRPHWGVEIMIADGKTHARRPGETTTAAAFESEGEVLVRSPGLLSAYLPVGLFSSSSSSSSSSGGPGKPDMSVTDEALTADGWFRTGDVGALSPDGRLRITDRLKELIKVRAFQVAPAELEAVLCSSEAVADAGVVGVYDAGEATEYPRAFVVPRAGMATMTPAQLQALAKELKELVEKRTTRYKWLVGGIVFVDQIPKSPSGKILRRVLKAGGKETKGFEVALYEKKKRDSKL
ncbi:hypothetical protein VTJ83DRAFT_1494, partial [Remersonia thermophila]